MIVFDIACESGHRFEGWFGSSDEFSRQRELGLIACPTCGSGEIGRVPSAPRINTGAVQTVPRPTTENQVKPDMGTVEGASPTPAQMQALYARVIDEVLARTENVGREFANEARRIHYNEADARPIRGVATKDEHDALVDEGIPVARLPIPPSDQWN